MNCVEYTRNQLLDLYGDECNFGTAINSIESELWGRGDIICEVYINDKFVTESEEKTISESSVKEIDRLKIVTRTQQELIKNTFESIRATIPELKKVAKETSKQIRQQGITENLKSFLQIIEGCQWMSEALFLLQPMVMDSIETEDVKNQWQKSQEFFAAVAQEALNSFEVKDMVLLSDILEYDLTSSLDKWSALIENNKDIKALYAS